MAEALLFDVVISGGGLSGLLTAIGLKQEAPSLSVAIVEPVTQTSQDKVQSNFDQRCLALSHGSLQLLNHWQVWSELKSNGWPIETIITSDRGHIGKTIMQAKDYGLNAMGQVASMHNLGCALKSVAKHFDIHWFCPDHITDLIMPTQQNDYVLLSLSSGQMLTGKLLVVAEGGNSPTRDKLNITNDTSEYQQAAIIANVRIDQSPKILKKYDSNAAFERFTTKGPIAFLPIAENEYNVVWTQSPDEAQVNMALNDVAFCEALQLAFGYSAGRITACSKRAFYPLSLTKVERLVSPRTVLLGNTAHTVHPIAGQGFNLGVRDIGVLVFEIKQALEQGKDIGDFSILNAYQKNRLNDIERITEFTDMLVRIFALPGRLPALTRTMGLMSLQKCDTLQQWLALHFMGSHKQFNLP
ncbi:FAD-dependent monooxygenase [Psychrosphaera aestuarii]|uniref:FAD-dependent monooxygenase n=1 Tax=Psychrosphaera aestuarii TaxID=1266052 RepID=UPI001B31E96E|nr:FAD-dependent monooxygenase [Psychrosphaera aestuarii]